VNPLREANSLFEDNAEYGFGMRLAVDSGYWILYRYNPLLSKEEKNPLILDSREPKLKYEAFLNNEVRYRSLAQQHPDTAISLFAKASQEAKERYEFYKNMAGR